MQEFLCGVLLCALVALVFAGYIQMREQQYAAYMHGGLAGVLGGVGVMWMKQGQNQAPDLELGKKPPMNLAMEFAEIMRTLHSEKMR